MDLPIGLVCKKCGNVFGALVSRVKVEQTPLQAVCMPCATKASQAKGIKLDSPENWAKALDD